MLRILALCSASFLAAAMFCQAAPLAPVSTAAGARERLQQFVNLDGGFDPNTPLKEALAYFRETYNFTILVDTEAFKVDLSVNEAENQPVALPKMHNIRLGQALRLLVRQGQGDYFVDGDGVVWIMPRDTMMARLLKRPVNLSLSKTSLQEALKKLSDEAGVSVVLDEQHGGNKARTPITAELRNVPVETAAGLIADLAGLKAVPLERVIYITSIENAAAAAEFPGALP